MADWRNLTVVQAFQSCQLKHPSARPIYVLSELAPWIFLRPKRQRMAPFAPRSQVIFRSIISLDFFVSDRFDQNSNCPTGAVHGLTAFFSPPIVASQGSHAVFPRAARKLVMLMPVAFGVALNSLSARSHLAKLPGLQRTSLAMQDCLRTVFTAWRKARLENA
jgi:hypothetical protein